jgi:DNA helicase-2/ATP-dependent DNA helicase PcrA
LPLVAALRLGDRFAVAAVVRRTSPLLERKTIEAAGEKQIEVLRKVKVACDGLLALVNEGEKPTGRSVLRYVAETNLFMIPEVLVPFAKADAIVAESDLGAAGDTGDQEEEVDVKSELGGWRLALEAPFNQIERYDRYVRGVSQFDTHQGVKGLEFPRVMVVVSDDEAQGFMFAYDKLFATKAKSKADLDNEAAGKETTIDRTRRLFYVTCSRAEQSLAVVYYTADPTLARDAMIRQGWFEPGEIELIA